MREDIKAQWIAALKSGDYQQGQSALKNFNDEQPTYCCLGVLCDLYAQAQDENFWRNRNLDVVTEILPKTVQEWAELPAPIVRVLYNGREQRLAWLNDEDKLSFTQLAELIDTGLVTT